MIIAIKLVLLKSQKKVDEKEKKSGYKKQSIFRTSLLSRTVINDWAAFSTSPSASSLLEHFLQGYSLQSNPPLFLLYPIIN